MNDRKESGPIIPISGIIALLAFIGISFYSQIPFKGTRPLSTDIQYERYDKATSRLWQDPFSAVLSHLKRLGKTVQIEWPPNIETIDLKEGKISEKSESTKTKEKTDGLAVAIESHGKGFVTVLGVMVPGTEYAEDEEARMRQRYAVMSGLRSRQFLPQDPEHIEYAFFKTDDSRKSHPVLLTNILPYEWFSHVQGREYILLLWLNEKTFQNQPLIYFSRLIKSLGKVKKWKIIGPSESATLKKMLTELKKEGTNNGPECEKFDGLEIYSAFATADAGSLLDVNDIASDTEIIKIFADKGIFFIRTIGSDKKLADVIVRELEDRRVFGNDKTIILVSESDTLYAGALRDVFSEALSAKKGGLIHASYLRGIDGILPGDEGKTDKKTAEGNQKDKTGIDLGTLEKPAGKSQYDYLRRHADKIYNGLERRHRQVGAIGLLGNNFHDKYLALQAFRQRFPQAIYFTTDLDAMWMHPAHLQWTRNLLIASQFNLSARPDRKTGDKTREINPSFRDNYQTSAFVAIQQAFPVPRKSEDLSKEQPVSSEPALFEIGNSGAINLSRRFESRYVSATIVTVLLMALIIFAILFFADKRVNRAVMSMFENRKKITIGLSISCLAFAILILVLIGFDALILENMEEEPLSFFDGISVWPSNIMRLLAVFLAVSFLYLSYRSLRKNAAEIEHLFFHFDEEKNRKPERCSNFIKRITSQDFFEEYTEDKPITSLWKEYLVRNDWRYRIWWILSAWFVYFMTMGLFLHVIGAPPEPPVRGHLSYQITIVLLILSGVFFSFSFLYVFDATRLCHQFVMNVTEKSHQWPTAALQKFFIDVKEDCRNEHERLLSEWRTVHLVAKRTEAVDRLIFYPLIIGIVLFIARHSYFDNWSTTIPVLVILSIGLLITWICAFIQRVDAEKLRKTSISRLREQEMTNLHRKNREGILKQIDHAIEDIQNIKQGAFAPFFQQPAFHSIILALSSIGGTYLIELVNTLNF